MSHQHTYGQSCTSISEEVCLRPFDHQHDGETHQAGFLFAHDRVAGDTGPHASQRCEGGVRTCSDDGREPWTQTGTLEGGDLTLSPSVLCTTDQFHGWVRDGKWVPA